MLHMGAGLDMVFGSSFGLFVELGYLAQWLFVATVERGQQSYYYDGIVDDGLGRQYSSFLLGFGGKWHF